MDSLVSITRKKIQQANESFVSLETPSYAPWDAQAAQARLLTFTQANWPKRLSQEADARQAAFKGWTCTGVNILECTLCEEILVQPINLQQLEDVKIEREALERVYVRQFCEGHREGCPWRLGRCRDDIFDSFLHQHEHQKFYEWIREDETFCVCSFGCTRALNNASQKYHRWFCPFIYKINKNQ